MNAQILTERVEAIRNRAKSLLLTQAIMNRREGFAFAKGILNGLLSVESSWSVVVQRDASNGGYGGATRFKTAWSALPNEIGNFSISDARQLLVAHGIDVTDEPIRLDSHTEAHLMQHGLKPPPKHP